MTRSISYTALDGIPEIQESDDLAAIIRTALDDHGLSLGTHDILVVAQKVVSKAEGRLVDLRDVRPSERAQDLATRTGKDARLVELVLSESSMVMRAVPGVLIVRHRLGHVMANAGIDRSNVYSPDGTEHVLLLPLDPDVSATALRARLLTLTGTAPGIIISDSFGRAWRNGVVNVALGSAGIPSLVDRRGEMDAYGRRLEVTQVALADALAAGAGICMGEGAERTPVVLVRGARSDAPPNNALALIRPAKEDLFP